MSFNFYKNWLIGKSILEKEDVKMSVLLLEKHEYKWGSKLCVNIHKFQNRYLLNNE